MTSIPAPPPRDFDFPAEEPGSITQRVTPLVSMSPWALSENAEDRAAIEAESQFWSAPPRLVESLPPAVLVAEAPARAPSLLRRVVASCLFGLCLVAVSGLLGFETVSLVRTAGQMEVPTLKP